MSIIIKRLLWNEWNVKHIAKHAVIPEEVEEICSNSYSYSSDDARHGRFIITGITSKGRILAVIIEPTEQEDIYYPVSARDASRKERKAYQERKGGENAA